MEGTKPNEEVLVLSLMRETNRYLARVWLWPRYTVTVCPSNHQLVARSRVTVRSIRAIDLRAVHAINYIRVALSKSEPAEFIDDATGAFLTCSNLTWSD